MKIWRCISIWLAGVFIFLSISCGTTGGKQVETVIYDMHRRVTKLDKGFDNINTIFADLSTKLQENEQTMKSLQSTIEENQVKMNQLSKELSELKTTLYRHLNLSVGGTTSPTISTPREVSGNVEILPPSSAQAPSIQAPQPTPVPPQPAIQQPPKQPQPTTTAQNQNITIAEPPKEEPTTSVNPKDDYMEAQRLFANEKYEEALARFDNHIKNFPTQFYLFHFELL